MPGPQASPHWIVPEYFGFETSINTGGLFGMFSGNPLPLAIISLIAIVGILWWMTLGGASHDRFLSIILGLILGGILGNLYDRLGLWGIRGVRDWILFKYRDHVWPNFNIADMLLVCGAGLMMFQAYRADVADRRSRQGATSHAGDSSAESDFGSGATDTSTATSDTTENPPTDELTASS